MSRDQVRDVSWWDGLLLAFSQQPHLGLSAFCRSRGVTVTQFCYQRRKRERAATAGAAGPKSVPAFREYLLPAGVTVSREPVVGMGMRLHVGGLVIELPPGFADEASLRAVLTCCR